MNGGCGVGNKSAIKFFLTLVISIAFLISFSHFSTFAVNSVFNRTESFAKGTEIGPIDIAGLSMNEAEEKLTSAVQEWENHALIVQLSEWKKPLDKQIFQFDVQQTLKNALEGQKNTLEVSINDVEYQKFFQLLETSAIQNVEHDQLQTDLIHIASTLTTENLMIDLYSYIPKNHKKEVILSESYFSEIGNYPDLIKWVNIVQELTIPAGQKVSLFTLLQEKNIPLSGESLNILSSLFYKALLPTNFDILERHTSLTLPSEIEIGYEAKIVSGKMDLLLENPNSINYKLKFVIENKQLVVTLVGLPFYYQYKIQTADLETFKPKKVIQYSALLGAGQQQIKEKGKDGARVKVFREIWDQKGNRIETDLISEDFYAPVHQVEVVGNQSDENEELTSMKK